MSVLKLSHPATVSPTTQKLKGGGIGHLSRVYAAGMLHPSLQGCIYGVPDKVPYVDAEPRSRF